jgi:hypothetical protein
MVALLGGLIVSRLCLVNIFLENTAISDMILFFLSTEFGEMEVNLRNYEEAFEPFFEDDLYLGVVAL